MSIVGDKSLFAIEWEEEQVMENGETTLCLCYWINSEEVGEYFNSDWFSFIQGGIMCALEKKCERCIENVFAYTKEYLFAATHGVFNTDPDEMMPVEPYIKIASLYQTQGGYYYWGYVSWVKNVFLISRASGMGIQDSANIVLFSDTTSKRQRLLWQNFRENEIIHEAILPEFYFEQVAQSFLDATASIKIPEPLASNKQPKKVKKAKKQIAYDFKLIL